MSAYEVVARSCRLLPDGVFAITFWAPVGSDWRPFTSPDPDALNIYLSP